MEPIYLNKEINILVIDDNTKNVQIIGQILLERDYNVSFATSGSEALELIKSQERFHLILLDILMPEMDGFEVCKKLKNNDVSAHIPIIFLTAKSDKASVVKGLELGANDYVVKPFNDDELLLRVKTQVDLLKQREKLEEINLDLEDKVKAKTAEILQVNKKLSILEKSKSDFLTLISHELRTPLNIINGFTEILHDSLKNTSHIEELNSLRQSTDRLISLAETALLITEIQLGKYEIEYDEIDLKAICENTARQAKFSFSEKAFQHEISVNGDPVAISGDSGLVSNIVGKITENAILAAEKNVRIIYELNFQTNKTTLRIIDNGPGFSGKDLEQLFSLFSKNGPNLRHQGFGLGLAAVKLAMDLLSGSVKAENMPEGGATVTLEFPHKH